MCNEYLCKKCKLKQSYYDNKQDYNNNEDNSILVYEDLVGPYNKLIPDTSVTIFSLVCLGVVLLFGR